MAILRAAGSLGSTPSSLAWRLPRLAKMAVAETNGIIKIAEPLGVMAGVIPRANSTSTAIFKSLIALKTRNGIIFSPHPLISEIKDLYFEAYYG